MGIHLTPVHFYQPIPDTTSLKLNLWTQESELVGINMNETRQLELLLAFSKFKEEYDNFRKMSVPYQYCTDNKQFGTVDGEVLYSMIRHFKPNRILEVGSGYSTLLSASAILKNKEEDKGYSGRLIAVEPYPNEILTAGVPGLSKLIQTCVQNIPLSDFSMLDEGDILFIDSSHVLKIGGDVQYLYLEVLPRLKKGVIVHFHDIFLPTEYPMDWVLKLHLFWTEQYLLQAFLMFNDSFQVLWASSYMHLRHPSLLEVNFSSYRRCEIRWPPGSFWIQKIK